MQKHIYTRELAPLNTGSVPRPARFNLRQTVEVHARTHKFFQELRTVLGFPPDTDYATLFEEAALPALEHILWYMRESPTAMKAMMRSLFDRLPVNDHVRNRYAALRARFEPKPRATSPDGRAALDHSLAPTQADLFADYEEDDL